MAVDGEMLFTPVSVSFKTERYVLAVKGVVALSRITVPGQGVLTNNSTSAHWI